MRLFIPITKIDEEKREVYGTLTQEVPDRDDEVFDYATSKPFFEKWSQYFQEATNGKSVGNLRAMHRNVAAGKLVAMSFDDDRRAIDIAAKVVDDDEWEKCVEGVYTGFSAAGHVMKRWRDPQNKALTRYTADPYEASLADFPCVPTATFKYVKVGGGAEDRTFKKNGAVDYADDAGRRFPLDTRSHVRHALAAWGQSATRGKYDAATQTVIGRKIREAARRHDIAVSEKTLMRGDYAKGLYDVGRLASLVQELAWAQESAEQEREWEVDDSPVPDKLLRAIATLTDVLEEMTGEECRELLAQLGMTEEFATSATPTTSKGSGTMPETNEKPTDAEREFRKRIAKGVVAKVAAMMDTAKAAHTMLQGHCEKLAAFHKDISGADDDDTGEKIAKVLSAPDAPATPAAALPATAAPDASADDRFAKLASRLEALEARATKAETERDDLKKVAEELAETGAAMAAAVGERRGVLKAVGKTDDVDPPSTPSAQDAEPKTPRDAFKKAFGRPQVVTGIPGADERPAAATR